MKEGFIDYVKEKDGEKKRVIVIPKKLYDSLKSDRAYKIVFEEVE